MKTPTPVAAIADRKHRTAEEIAAANEAHIATLSGIAEKSQKRRRRFEFEKPPTRIRRRGYPLVGTGGIDTRQDPLKTLLEREEQAERNQRIRSRRKAAA